MALGLSTTFVNTLLGTGTTAGVPEQFGGGTLVLYSGTAPAGPNEALSGDTVLATFTFSAAGSWSAPSAGVLNMALAATTVTAAATGTASFFRILNSSGTALIQGTVTATGGGGDITISSTSITSGDGVSITGTPTISWAVA